jgi:hypothetical protein
VQAIRARILIFMLRPLLLGCIQLFISTTVIVSIKDQFNLSTNISNKSVDNKICV